MELTQALHRKCQRHPDKVVLVCGTRRRCWYELRDRTARLATVLRSQGEGQGDRVAIWSPNSIEFIEAFFAQRADQRHRPALRRHPPYFPAEVQVNPEIQERLAREVPLGGLVTAREDVQVAAYLCSSAGDSFVGQVFPVCGGWVARQGNAYMGASRIASEVFA